MRHLIMPNFVPIGQSRFSIFQDGGCPPSLICFTLVWTTHEAYLVDFITVQNLVANCNRLCNFEDTRF